MPDLTKNQKSTKSKFAPTAEQKLATKHTGSDLLLSAGAGSGKTATLADRIVKRISGKRKKDISRMLVVTYTKDAANELKTRIASKISEQLAQNPKDPHLCEQFIKVTSADISTIHSFCLKSIRPYLNLFDLDNDMRIAEDQELSLLRMEAMNEVLDEFYEADTIDPDFLLVVDCYSSYTDDSSLASSLLTLHQKELSSCVDGIEILMKKPDTSSDFFDTPHGKILLNYVKRTVNHFSPLIDDLYSQATSDSNNRKYVEHLGELERIYTSLASALDKPTYEVIKIILQSFDPKNVGKTRKGEEPTIDKDYFDYVRSKARAAIEDLRDDYFYTDNATINSTFEQNYKICSAIYKVLKKFEERFQEKKKKHALCDFLDLEKLTLKLFYKENGSISDIAREISKNYDELYIDEYQDVNSVQDKIFQAIAKNNRFMVGDIKQSIYGFRSAEPELFSDYRNKFIPYGNKCKSKKQGRTIFMSDNFRCDSSVIDLTNHISDYMFANSHGFKYVPDGDKLKFSKKYDEKDENGKKIKYEFKNAKLCIIDKSNIPKDSYLKECDPQAEFVAQEIKRLLETGKLPNNKKIEPKHIAILLKKYKGHADKYIKALDKYGIKHEFVQKANFFEKPHIILLLSILNAIDNPSKDIYLASALYSHIFKFSLDDLIKIKKFSSVKEDETAKEPPPRNLYSALLYYKDNCSDDSSLKQDVINFITTIDTYKKDTRKMTSYEVLSYIMNATNYLSYCNKEERQDVIKLYNIARDHERGSYKGLYSFLRHIDDIAKEGSGSETVTSDPENSVKIITMHQSKGLEYEVCFLCDLEKSYFYEQNKPDILFNKNLGICGFVSRNGGIVKYDNLVRKCVDLANEDEVREEAMRLLYVAMTRARSYLYLTASVAGLTEKKKNAKYKIAPDEYALYSKNSHIDIIMSACAYPLSFLDEMPPLGENEIYEFKGNTDDTDTTKTSVEEFKKLLKERFDFKYAHSQLEKIPSKLSISTLHPSVLDDEENPEYQKKYKINSLPEFALDKKKITTGSDRGTATHVFLQFCDFKNLKQNGYENELDNLLNNSFISKEYKDIINEEHIKNFINSNMMKEFLNAKSIIREFRFNVLLPAKDFSTDKNSGLTDEKVLVQGVVDCIYETKDGELILVDYKTDNVPKETHEDALKSKHRIQLTNYKRALDMMLEPYNHKISKVYIYSVPYANMIELS